MNAEEERPFPWRKANGSPYDSPGPSGPAIVHLPGADYSVEPTGGVGIDSGRDRWRTVCLTCEAAGRRDCAPYGHDPGVLHPNSTGHETWILAHHEKFHAALAGSK